MGSPSRGPCWHGCCDLIVKLGLTIGAVSRYLAQRCAKVGGGLRRGLGSLWNESKCYLQLGCQTKLRDSMQ